MSRVLDALPLVLGGVLCLFEASILVLALVHWVKASTRPQPPRSSAFWDCEGTERHTFEKLRAKAASDPGSLQGPVDLSKLRPELAREVQRLRDAVAGLEPEQQAAIAMAERSSTGRLVTSSIGEELACCLGALLAGITLFFLPPGPYRWLGLGVQVGLALLPLWLISPRNPTEARRVEVWAETAYQLSEYTSHPQAVLEGVMRVEQAAQDLEPQYSCVVRYWRDRRKALQRWLDQA